MALPGPVRMGHRRAMTDELHAALDWSGLAIMDIDECYEALDGQPIGRLGFVDQGAPVILPVNFTTDGRTIVFRTGQGSKLAAAIMESPVCLEVDGWDPVAHTGWSVLVKGTAEEIVDDTTIAHLATLPVRPWSRPDLRWHWVRVRVDEVSGRRVTSGSAGSAPPR